MVFKRENVVVGIFVLVGVAICAGLVIAYGGGRTLFASTYDVGVVFAGGVQGVQAGQGITLSGKRIGETKDVQFANPTDLTKGVKVIVAVERQYDLPQACEVVVLGNLMGLGRPIIELVVLDPSRPERVPKDGRGAIPGRMSHPLDQLVPHHMQRTLDEAAKHIGDLAAALKPAAENFGRLLERTRVEDVDAAKTQANLDTLVQRFDASLKSLNKVFGDEANQKNFAEVLANLRKTSENATVVSGNLREMTANGRQMADDTGRLIRGLTTAADNLSSVLKGLDQTVTAANSGQGTVGLLLSDNRLYEEMLLSVKRLTKMLDDMREVLDLAKKGQLRIRAL